jgi:hypothetical protein
MKRRGVRPFLSRSPHPRKRQERPFSLPRCHSCSPTFLGLRMWFVEAGCSVGTPELHVGSTSVIEHRAHISDLFSVGRVNLGQGIIVALAVGA